MPVDPGIIGVALTTVTQGATQFHSFLPPLRDVRRADPVNDPQTAADVRIGEVAAVTLTVGIGVIASSLTGSNVPAVTAVVMCAVLVCLYESTLRADRPLEPKSVLKLAPVESIS